MTMATSLPIRAMLISFALSAIAAGQATTTQKPANQPCSAANQTSPKPSDKPCTPPADTKQQSPAEQFPFPGEPSKPASSDDSPDAPAPASSKKSAAEAHPFPSDAPPALPGSDASGYSSSSSSSDDSSSNADPDAKPAIPAPDTSDAKPTRKKLPKVEKIQTPEDRAAEDLSVAKFYEDRGNLNAAYLRAKDAVQVQPDDPYTHFALARIAQKLQKRDEAISEFNAYLKLDPDGLNIKAARKALSQLQ
jgi:tetratricopeptide (TPR) repeat protein